MKWFLKRPLTITRKAMTRPPRIILAFMLLVPVIPARCSGCDKPKRHYLGDNIDGGYVMREECDKPVDDCLKKCHNRAASRTCTDCCSDQEFLCSTQQPYSMDYCDGAR